MRIYYNNIINDATLIPSSADAAQDVDFLKIPHLTQTFKFAGHNENLVIYFDDAVNIKSFICDIGNLSLTGTYILQGNDSDSWSSPAYTKTLNITETMIYADLDETYQYWRFVIESVNDIEIGLIYMGGAYLQMPALGENNILYYHTTSKQSFAISGQIYGDEGYKYMETKFDFPQISEVSGVGPDGHTVVATRKEIINMFNEADNNNPIWVMLWEKNLDEYAPLFCVINQDNINFQKLTYGKYYSTSLTLRQTM